MEHAEDRERSDEARTSADEAIYATWENLLSTSYPAFLRKLGLRKVAVSAEGATITVSDGTEYLDCVGGYGLFNIGHNHPQIVASLTAQLREKQLFTKPFITGIQAELATALADVTPGELTCSFICNSGSEAIDNALKLARLTSKRPGILAAEKSFHGYTFGALSVSGIRSFRRPFEPLVPAINYIPFNDIQALENALQPDTGAVVLEPIQHEAGIRVPNHDYFQRVRRLCDQNGTLLILDEIKTGLGKTGTLFACEHYGVIPDILVLGKSLGGGLVPIGAMIARERLWKKFGLSFPMSASSFAGNTLACRAALTTLAILRQSLLLDECRKKGTILLDALRTCAQRCPLLVRDVSGLGLLIAVEITSRQKALELAREMIRQRVLLLPAFGNASVLMIEPPLVISVEQIEKLVRVFGEACLAIAA